MEKVVSLCKRRGFVFPTAEKYGGLQGFWDWGPLGVEFKAEEFPPEADAGDAGRAGAGERV